MGKCKRSLKVLLVLMLIFSLAFANISVVYAASKKISVKVNPVTVVINLKTVKIDNFEFGGKYYLQMQDVCSYLGIDYIYTAKTKSLSVVDQKPAKPVAPAKALFSSDKPMITKSVSIQESPVTVKINNKVVKIQHYLIGNSIFFSASDIASQLNRTFAYDNTSKTINITDKKPTTPIFKPSTIEKTDKDVLLTIDNWGNAPKKEYKIDDGNWLPYTTPVAIPRNCFVYARGTNGANVQSDIASLELRNIHKLLNKVDVSKLSKWSVKILCYDINGELIGTGSGFIASSDGKIITNYHVIDMIQKIKVMMPDDKLYDVLGVTACDVRNDMAVLKINAANLPTAILGNSDDLALGEEVVTIGYPLGEGVSVTFGNVSSMTASSEYRESSHDIQISAPISHGNSGGPLLNMYGEVMGINYLSTVDAQNMNYAIPINEIKPLLASSTVKTLANVMKDTYPKMDELQYQYYLYCNYPTYTIEDYSFTFSNIFLEKDSNYPNDLYVDVLLSSMQYGEVLLAELDGKRSDVEKWTDDLYQKVKAQFPNKNVYVGIIFADSFKTQPQGYTSDQIKYNSQTGLYDVFKVKLWYGYENNQLFLRWL